MEDACNQAGIQPDVVLAAHAHNYQRFTLSVNFQKQNGQVPYYVVGTGGRGTIPVQKADGSSTGDHRFDSSFVGYGNLTLKVNSSQIEFYFTQVDGTGKKSSFDKAIRVDLKTHQLV